VYVRCGVTTIKLGVLATHLAPDGSHAAKARIQRKAGSFGWFLVLGSSPKPSGFRARRSKWRWVLRSPPLLVVVFAGPRRRGEFGIGERWRK